PVLRGARHAFASSRTSISCSRQVTSWRSLVRGQRGKRRSYAALPACSVLTTAPCSRRRPPAAEAERACHMSEDATPARSYRASAATTAVHESSFSTNHFDRAAAPPPLLPG